MDLWVRSQNREELAKPVSLYICAETNDIWADLGFGHKTCFGIYSTKERALEVLDLIESEILLQDKPYPGVEDEYNITDNIVYQMPID